MAIAETNTQTRNRDIFAILDGWLDAVKLNRRRNAIYRQTLRELSSLSERELNDIGLSRSQVQQVSLQAAHMAC
jgi:uncharacterized protein YjiS (DUF1127 family)